MAATTRKRRRRPPETRAPSLPAVDPILGWHPPSPDEIARIRILTRPYEWFTNPLFLGIEQVPRRGPALLVGNHTLLGVWDVPQLFLELHDKRGVLPRSLGHHVHFRIPVWRDLLARFGTVDGTRENCARLMEARQFVLVFPGGAREVTKRRGERYRLFWKERLGFVRLAVRHGCPIVPVSAVGAEETFDILADADTRAYGLVKPLFRALGLGDDELMPLVTPLPRPERLYFKFGRRIPTRRWRGREDDEEVLLELRDRVKRAVERGIAELQEIQARDPDRNAFERLRRTFVRRG